MKLNYLSFALIFILFINAMEQERSQLVKQTSEEEEIIEQSEILDFESAKQFAHQVLHKHSSLKDLQKALRNINKIDEKYLSENDKQILYSLRWQLFQAIDQVIKQIEKESARPRAKSF